MNITLNQKTLRKIQQRRFLVLFMSIAFFTSLFALIPQLKTYAHKQMKPGKRIILSSIQTNISNSLQETQRILKVQTHKGLFVEIYTNKNGQSTLKQKIKLNDKRDGFFVFNGESSNLILDDIDGDETAELLVPSYDENLVAHLNVFSFNKESGSFVQIN